jgi:hypothetical protein
MLQDRQHLTDDRVRALPYRRLIVKCQMMLERMAQERLEQWQVAAFVGWQNYIFTPLKKGKKAPSLEHYLKRLHLADKDNEAKMSPEQKAKLIAQVKADEEELSAAMAAAAQERKRQQDAA